VRRLNGGGDCSRQHGREHVGLEIGAGPLRDRRSQHPLRGQMRPEVLPLQRRRGDHEPDALDPLLARGLGAARVPLDDGVRNRLHQRFAGRTASKLLAHSQAAFHATRTDRLVFAREIVVARPCGGPGLGRDVLDEHLVKAALHRQAHGRRAERLAGSRLLPLTPAFRFNIHAASLVQTCVIRKNRAAATLLITQIGPSPEAMSHFR
jgi:hypothetical protein